jgi:metastasis-associated protein MTA
LQDTYYYSLVYDGIQRTLIADKGEIRIGEKYQAKCTPLLSDDERANYRVKAEENIETSMYHPRHSLSDRDIDQYLIVAR